MFEAAELGSQVSKQDYEAEVPRLRVDLINAQYELRKADFPVLIVLVGDDRPGCSALVNLLNAWMDARFVQTHVFGSLAEEERERPRFWRYWRALPGRGELAIFTGVWVLGTLGERLEDRIDDATLERRLAHMERFERELVDDGALVLKFWLHLPRKEFKKRLKRAKKDPDAEWRVDEADRWIGKRWDEVAGLAERLIRRTDAGPAPWRVVESTDVRHRNLTVARAILAALQARLAAPEAGASASAPAPEPVTLAKSVLSRVDLSSTVAYPRYKDERAALQARLRRLTQRAREERVATVLVFEGWDAAGKGGVIRRLTEAMDVQDYRVVAIGVPTDEELAHHYLWRFWRRLPRDGSLLIFDRSWYGRVLVERVEGLGEPRAWQRAYGEINDFEDQLAEHGTLLRKFWLHLDRDEQLRRFRAREQTPYKKYKITDEDYRNRERWEDYEHAVNEMVARTSTALSPWHLVAANDKRWARVEVLRIVCEGLEERLGRG